MENRDELIDTYGYQADIFSKGYYMMGYLLNSNFVKKEVIKRNMSDIYIYGGGYLGIQLYRAIIPYVNVVAVVDKKGKLVIDSIDDISVINMDIFQRQYKNEIVILTPFKFYSEIYHELREFIMEDKIIFLEEFGR